MTIYNDRTPYTYLIGWSNLGFYYYGRRTGKNCHPDDLFRTYFTSSKYVAYILKKYGDPDLIQIRKVFTGKNKVVACKAWEETVLRRLKASTNPKMLNRHNGSRKFDATGHVTVFDTRTNDIKQVTVAEYRDSSEYESILKGKVTAGIFDDSGNLTYTLIASEEYKQNRSKYLHSCEGTIWVTNKITRLSYRISLEEFHQNRAIYEHHSDNNKLLPHQIERIRQLHTNKPKNKTHREKISVALKKHIRTEEHQQKINEAQRNSKKTCHPIIINGTTYDSISNAAKAYNTTVGQICNMLAGRKPIRKDFWEIRKI